jgi:hypothetical protein
MKEIIPDVEGTTDHAHGGWARVDNLYHKMIACYEMLCKASEHKIS